MPGPEPSAAGHVSPAGKAEEPLHKGYQVAIKSMPWDHIWQWSEMPDGTWAALEILLLDKISTGFPGAIQLLERFELPNSFLLVMEHPEWSQDLFHFILDWGFLPEEIAWRLFCQVLKAVQHCISCGPALGHQAREHPPQSGHR
ncbi:serine/threonine-protein kinase pim-1-like protein [Willisornis vidua]|uniref:non-specific serine/threonine protein kinase n=1 Tax=Willisornis vidua TaxID=1566151 RepID=A0ABQ9D2H7_9PASS|nr:serine/threonine-protein kinase pim-1-like protein [Willisornis vidua]